jgi:hypothetical protein
MLIIGLALSFIGLVLISFQFIFPSLFSEETHTRLFMIAVRMVIIGAVLSLLYVTFLVLQR